jgi:hypothetical protein
MSKKILFLNILLFTALLLSCKKKEDVIAISEKQKLLLGKWQQAEIYEPNGTNILPPCESANNTIFEFKSDGKCNISSAGACTTNRTSAYAFSAGGELFALEGFFYYVQLLDANEFRFSSGSGGTGFRQVWKRVR